MPPHRTAPAALPLRVRPVLALLAAIAVLVLGNGLQGTLLGVRAGLEAFQEVTIGAIMSAYFAGYVLGSVVGPRLVATVGHIRVFAGMASLASAATLGHLLLIDPLAWALLRAASGFCYAGLVMVAESWLNSQAVPETRGRLLSLYGMVMMGAWTASQLLLNLAPVRGFELFALVSILLSLALVPVTLFRTLAPPTPVTARLGLAEVYRISPVGFTGSLIVGLTMSAFWGMGPTFAQAIGLHAAALSAFMAMPMFGALVLQWPMGWLSDLVDRRLVITYASLATALAAAVLSWGAALPLPALVVAALVFGGFGLPIYSICVANTNDFLGPDELLPAASALLTLYGLGAAVGPFAASLAMRVAGPDGLFHYIGVLQVVLTGLALLQTARRAPPAREEREAYVAMPGASHVGTHVALELDPRSGGERSAGR